MYKCSKSNKLQSFTHYMNIQNIWDTLEKDSHNCLVHLQTSKICMNIQYWYYVLLQFSKSYLSLSALELYTWATKLTEKQEILKIHTDIICYCTYQYHAKVSLRLPLCLAVHLINWWAEEESVYSRMSICPWDPTSSLPQLLLQQVLQLVSDQTTSEQDVKLLSPQTFHCHTELHHLKHTKEAIKGFFVSHNLNT